MVCEEGCLKKLFDPSDSYSNAKIFLEGGGLLIENKMKHPREIWKNVPVILTTSKLPSVFRPPKRH